MLLLHPHPPSDPLTDHLSEFEELAVSAGLDVRGTVTASIATPRPKFYFGSGKVEEIADVVAESDIDVLLCNCHLAPVQERNLEQALACRVFDRTTLILDIFAQRARSHEGKLQVELAQLQHLSTRLVRGWTHLERQKGGIGLRGPGETQLETDRRLLADRVRGLKARLQKVERQRDQGRRARQRRDVPTVALVGYTNAGKSTLFNKMTDSATHAADQLFATLDTTMRRIDGLACGPVVLADTVGFIRDLPHDLVAAFKATLTETRDADLLLLVVDASDGEHAMKVAEVEAVLEEIGADHVPVLKVMNKIDRVESAPARLDVDDSGVVRSVSLSALSGEGLSLLFDAIERRFVGRYVQHQLRVPTELPRLRAFLHQHGQILNENFVEGEGWLVDAIMDNASDRKLRALDGAEGRCIRDQLVNH